MDETKDERIKLNENFQNKISQLPVLLEELEMRPLMPLFNMENIPNKGVYIIYENGRPVFVGRSDKMRIRIKEHARQSSSHNKAELAFGIAKKIAEQKYIDVNRPRIKLERDPIFADLFASAKERVGRMWVRVIEVEDPITRILFEIYAAITLDTLEYNDFGIE